MKLSYFGYMVKSLTDGENRLVDLRSLVEGFSRWDNIVEKRKMAWNGEQLFLLPTNAPSVYLFVQARDREIIKKIEKSKKIAVTDIRHALQQGESVGFASYVIFEKHWFGIACRVLSPRVTAFSAFMSQVLELLKCKYKFVPRALMEKLPKSEVQDLQEVSSISIEMSIANPFAKDLVNMVTGGARNALDDVASLEIRIKRRRKGKRSLLPALKGALRQIPTANLESLDVRARRQAGEHMADLYIVGQGGLRDDIVAQDENRIPVEIVNRASASEIRKEKVKEFVDGESQASAPASSLGLDWKSAIGRSGLSGS